MKKAVFLLLLLTPSLALADGSLVIQRNVTTIAATPYSGNLSTETVGSFVSSGTVTSSTMGFTCTSDTKLLVAFVAYRRNASQGINNITFGGQDFSFIGQNPAGVLRGEIWQLQNPPAVSGSIAVTMSASTPGYGMTALSFKSTSTITTLYRAGSVATQSVTSSVISTNTLPGDIMFSFLLKQDPTTSDPTLNTSTATLQSNFTFGATTNGGYFKMATLPPATDFNGKLDYSWTTLANHGHICAVARP